MGLIHLNKQQQETNRQTNYSSTKRYKTKQITTLVETNPPPSPTPRGLLFNFEFSRGSCKQGVSSRQGIRMYVLQPYFKNRQVNCSFVECPVFLMLVLSPMLYMFLVISISYVISDFVICRSVLDDFYVRKTSLRNHW